MKLEMLTPGDATVYRVGIERNEQGTFIAVGEGTSTMRAFLFGSHAPSFDYYCEKMGGSKVNRCTLLVGYLALCRALGSEPFNVTGFETAQLERYRDYFSERG